MAKIHMVLQGKGGVGKSMIAATIAQYKAGKGQKPLCIDTDPVNATFEGYKALNVRRLNIMDGDEINTRNFDALVEMIASAEGDVIIDNGASSFVPLSHYLISNQVPPKVLNSRCSVCTSGGSAPSQDCRWRRRRARSCSQYSTASRVAMDSAA